MNDTLFILFSIDSLTMVCLPPKCKDWKRQLLFFFLTIILVHLGMTLAAQAGPAFPLYTCIQKNVRFWEAIYGHYTTRQGVIHDTEDLGRIYGVVELIDWKLPWAAMVNGKRIEREKGRIRDILEALASGRAPQTAEVRRIAALFPQKRHTNFSHARDTIRLQLGQKDRFAEGVIRSGRYLADFRHTFATYGLPQDLAYLPHVESSFNPRAFSKAGAAGLWQFTRGTGSDYLAINTLVDERYDPYLATDAAARLLRDNYKALGSWPLALTAYNYGRAGMLRAVRIHGGYERIFSSYDEGYFKFAARNFYSEFIAATRVAKRLEAISTLRKDQPESLITYQLRTATPIARLLTQTGLSREQFIRLNPALQKPVLEGKQPAPAGYLARKPGPKRSRAARIAQKSTPQMPKIKILGHQSALTPTKVTYIVQNGDSVLSIARKFNISPNVVRAANKQGTVVRTGEKLLIPQHN
ncbi:MAG: transglycosylase SLT domain-containing protein [Desulfobulbus sp.]